MTKLIIVFAITAAIFLTQSHGRTIMLDEEQVETVEGKTFYVLSMCKDG